MYLRLRCYSVGTLNHVFHIPTGWLGCFLRAIMIHVKQGQSPAIFATTLGLHLDHVVVEWSTPWAYPLKCRGGDASHC